jgi:protein TonB
MRVLTPMLLAAALVGVTVSSAMATPEIGSSRTMAPAPAAEPAPAGVASVRCVLAEQGALKDCQVLSESPTGIGIGEAALKMASEFKMPAGQPGRVVTIPMRFLLAPGQQPPGLSTP